MKLQDKLGVVRLCCEFGRDEQTGIVISGLTPRILIIRFML